MSFESRLQNDELALIAELFTLQTGSKVDRYTTHHTNIDFDGKAYEARPIQRSAFTLDNSFRAVNVTISAPLVAPLLSYIANSPVEPVVVKIYRVFVDYPADYRLIFTGIVKTVTIEDKIVTAICESLSDILRVKLPKIVHQAYCNHNLFDVGCTLIENTYKVDATVNISDSDLTSATFAGYVDGYFTGGHAAVDTDLRLITNHVGDTITLQVPFDERLENGDDISIFPGCDKSGETCVNKFGNIENFLGFPYIPTFNPALSGFR